MKSVEIVSWLKQNQDNLSTPCYLYDPAELDGALAALGGLLPRGARIFYSAKANPQVAVLRHLNARGAGAEAVSAGELAARPRGRLLSGGLDPLE